LHRADARHLLKASATRESRRDWRESILAWLGQLGFGRLLARNTCRLLEPLNIASACQCSGLAAVVFKNSFPPDRAEGHVMGARTACW